MNPRALTPLFRCTERWLKPSLPPGTIPYPAPASGNHPGEAWFLAIATLSLTATWAVPASASLSSFWLRLPAIIITLFFIPHLIMALVALVSPWLAGRNLNRETAQDWACLAVMTAWAATHSTDENWTSAISRGWLVFAGLNLLLLPTQLKAKPWQQG